MLVINTRLAIPLEEIQLQAVRSQGAGGQNVNKVSSAIHLRFDIAASSLPQDVKTRLLALNDARITRDGIIVIKAQTQRTQERNRQEALARLRHLIQSAVAVRRPRVSTKPTRGSVLRRLDTKKKQSSTKRLRDKVRPD